MNIRIGIDVGSTNTDGVAIDENNKILVTEKNQTSADISTGLFKTLTNVIKKLGTDKSQIKQVMIGTTHGLNAISARVGLEKVLAIRIGLPAGEGIPPMSDWPLDLKEAIGNNILMVRGGHEYTGDEIVPFDAEGLKEKLKEYKGKIHSVAITSIFSFVNPKHEIEAENIVKEVLGDDTSITLSHNISSLGLLERENSTILNSAIRLLMIKIINSIKETLVKLGLNAVNLYFSQNDGTVASSDFVEKFPIFTVAGPISNSIRGAFVLTHVENAVVFDIGGTTTNIGVLTNGYPRESSNPVIIGGVRTNFRMPDIIAIPLGGGTIIDKNVGPRSVGYKLTKEAISFGGDTLTATDVALNIKKIDFDRTDRKRVLEKYSIDYLDNTYSKMRAIWEENLDKVKVKGGDVELIAVGGGSFMIPNNLKGASKIKIPEGGQYANAIGAATSLIGAKIEKAYSYDAIKRDDAILETINEANSLAIQAGALPSSIEVKEIDEVSMPYLPGNSVKLSVKVVGKMI
ncbi:MULTISPECIES: hydantoinase/oxoprolinase family protein [unclassified Acidiplasma]|uniref:hydantoinase/oxoprolinase family protein n=1 Tax=unclassified Acidiplasma TaxID=2641301 RepID=UPI0005E8D5CA|nr:MULTISPECIES: hydantoinase/oxoprolinase family protein [unclassified Acidiplasma]KJE48557.1 hydantoinase subunit beta [Acidiplasma sp. MBA-1]WMT55288.1 MAG: hydantoinase/oxoprolinase family protein [Acidiplasma sp.]